MSEMMRDYLLANAGAIGAITAGVDEALKDNQDITHVRVVDGQAEILLGESTLQDADLEGVDQQEAQQMVDVDNFATKEIAKKEAEAGVQTRILRRVLVGGGFPNLTPAENLERIGLWPVSYTADWMGKWVVDEEIDFTNGQTTIVNTVCINRVSVDTGLLNLGLPSSTRYKVSIDDGSVEDRLYIVRDGDELIGLEHNLETNDDRFYEECTELMGLAALDFVNDISHLMAGYYADDAVKTKAILDQTYRKYSLPFDPVKVEYLLNQAQARAVNARAAIELESSVNCRLPGSDVLDRFVDYTRYFTN